MKDALGSVQSVLVLGGGSDIALATVRKLVARRARTIVLAARDPTRSPTIADELRGAGATTVETVAFDAHDTDRARRVRRRRVRRVSATSTSRCSRSACSATRRKPEQRRRGRGRHRRGELRRHGVGRGADRAAHARAGPRHDRGALVGRRRARPRSNFVYGSSKAGMDAFFQGLGDSLVGTGVHVMIVRPGFVHTKMTEGMDAAPLSTTPEAVADAIVQRARTWQARRCGCRRPCAT